MYYHIKIKYNIVNESGKNVTKNEEYLVQNCEFHAEAETKGYEHASTYGFENADVTIVKRSKIRELVNENPKEEEYLICVYKDNRYHIGKIYLIFFMSISLI